MIERWIDRVLDILEELDHEQQNLAVGQAMSGRLSEKICDIWGEDFSHTKFTDQERGLEFELFGELD